MELQRLLNPEYFYRPSQILRRLSFKPSLDATLPLPWRCAITTNSTDTIGRAIATQGVYDLPVTEALMRLADPDETALDVGANIGYMSLVLALSVGSRGRVICFEPNADVLPKLRRNADNWKALNAAPIEIHSVALSDHEGAGSLGFPAAYSENLGVASLEFGEGGVRVPLCRLDSLDLSSAGVMKVDVEGHEASVFAGAAKLLVKKQIRDIVFEEHDAYPARSHAVLLEHGYQVFRLTRSAWGPLLLPPQAPPRQAHSPSNFLATADASRAEARFRARGWTALSSGPRHSQM